jgi:methylated-DNA-[protein]-cysteine S-methyltransferase
MIDRVSYSIQQSPIGELRLTSMAGALTGIWMLEPDDEVRVAPGWVREEEPFAAAWEQLTAYFAGDLTEFDLQLAPRGTPFQLRVWDALRTIPFGQTISYAELARRIDDPRAVRAVGAANGRNPLPIVLPCHRVIGADGSLTGYGGGLDRKRILLELEGIRGWETSGRGRRKRPAEQAELLV